MRILQHYTTHTELGSKNLAALHYTQTQPESENFAAPFEVFSELFQTFQDSFDGIEIANDKAGRYHDDSIFILVLFV